MEQVNKFTEAAIQMTSLHNANKVAALPTQKILIIQILGEDDEENDRRIMVTIHEMDLSLYNETNLVASFLSHQETSSPSVAPTGKPEGDCTIGSVSIEFSESHCQANENWGERASEEVTKVVSVAFLKVTSATKQ